MSPDCGVKGEQADEQPARGIYTPQQLDAMRRARRGLSPRGPVPVNAPHLHPAGRIGVRGSAWLRPSGLR